MANKAIIFGSILAFGVLMAAQPVCGQEVENEAQEPEPIHPYKEVSKIVEPVDGFSILIEGGINVWNGDFPTGRFTNFGYPSAGLALEYNFNSAWGIGAQYMFDWPQVKLTSGKVVDVIPVNPSGATSLSNGETMYKAMMHKGQIYATLDLIDLFYPRAEKKIFALTLMAGAGMAWYNNSISYHDSLDVSIRNDGSSNMNKNYYIENAPDNGYSTAGYLVFGAGLEFNVSRSIALALRAQYDVFLDDKVDTRYRYLANKRNDGLADVTLALRWKINANHKNHFRNVASNDLLLSKLEKQNAKAKADEWSRLKDTIVIYHKDTVVIAEHHESVQTTQQNDKYYYTYFAHASCTLNEDNLLTIQQVAARMQHEPSLFVQIVGYCDNTGSDAFNDKLGLCRAQVVADELTAEYGIDENRVFVLGGGKIKGGRSEGSYGPNRRVEMIMLQAQEMDSVRLQHQKDIERREAAKAVRTQKVTREIEEFEILEEIDAPANRSFSSLARKYYNNTFCWVYIWLANRDVVANPNQLRDGTHLRIPVLTDEQRTITKEEAHALAEQKMKE